MKILIFGSSGFLGTKLKKLFLEKGHEVFGTDFNGNSDFKIDATKFSLVLKIIKEKKPEIVIDTVGLTNSIDCERNPKKAKNLNYLTAKNISKACEINGSKMFFFSSSYVFDGKKGEYTENDSTNPLGVYGKTKLMAEKEVLKNKWNVVFRVDIMYGYNGKNCPNGIFQKIIDGTEIGLLEPDQKRSPLFVEDIPEVILALNKINKGGIFHLAGPDNILIKHFLISLEKIIRTKSLIKIGNNQDLKIIPKNSNLNSEKIKSLGIKTTPLEEALKIIKKQIISQKL